MKFKDYYTEKHGVWPAHECERVDVAMARLADTFADFVDEYHGLQKGEYEAYPRGHGVFGTQDAREVSEKYQMYNGYEPMGVDK